MLARTRLRLIAVHSIKDQTAPHGATCELGPIWLDCEGDQIKIYDSPAGFLGDLIDDGDGKPTDFPAIAIYVDRDRYEFGGTMESKLRGNLSLIIEIYAASDSDWGAEDIVDAIHERILYRLFRNEPLTIDGTQFSPLLKYAPSGLTVTNERTRGGDRILYMRQLEFVVPVFDCIEPPDCNPVDVICFDPVETPATCAP